MARTKGKKYKYDAAISVAGEDRTRARELAGFLRARGLSVFYDEHCRSYLWGKDVKEYERVFGPESRFVIPFVSKHYVAKAWTRHEFAIARGEAERRKGEFILPVRVDETPLLGLHEDVNYVSLTELRV